MCVMSNSTTEGLEAGAWVAIGIATAAAVSLVVFVAWYVTLRKGATFSRPAIFRPSAPLREEAVGAAPTGTRSFTKLFTLP